MVSTSKILTVSYGTFSCTLEGFDDSFDTMKAIAEYFRDLAADDRYFGAEPPTPDAEMLAKIAEKEISRRVEAHEDQGKIFLRADDPETDDTPPPSPTTKAAPLAEEVVEEAAEEVEAPADDHDVVTDTIEEAVVHVDNADDAIEEITELDPIEDVVAGVDTNTIEPDLSDILEDAEIATVESDVDEDIQPEDQPQTEVKDGDEDENSVADRLRRIRSVVARGTADLSQDGFSEDEHAQDFLADTVSELDAALLADDEAERDLTARGEDEAAPEDQIEEIETTEETLATLSAQLIEDAEQLSPEPVAEPTAAEEETLAQLLADTLPEANEDIIETDNLTSETEPTDVAEQVDGTDVEVLVDEDAAQPPKKPLRARVLKMRRTDFDAAVAEGDLEETFDMMADDPAEGEPAEAILSDEDEAELLRELAAVEAELETTTPSDLSETQDSAADHDALILEDALETASDDVAEAADDAAERVQVQLPDTDEDSDVSRIFDQAETQLDAPDTNERRSAIQHLRAAVAANAAEKDAGSELRPETDANPYRSDLASVVRPRRPDTSGDHADSARNRPQRPVEKRPAPLKLVAEQRIDTPREPVRPRRVSAPEPDAADIVQAEAHSSFASFTKELGVTSLPELLEAAAAYMSDVEGLDQFSRPMLFGRVKQVEADDFSREEALRSFGYLLREGKIQKMRAGRFSVTDLTEYRPQNQSAG